MKLGIGLDISFDTKTLWRIGINRQRAILSLGWVCFQILFFSPTHKVMELSDMVDDFLSKRSRADAKER